MPRECAISQRHLSELSRGDQRLCPRVMSMTSAMLLAIGLMLVSGNAFAQTVGRVHTETRAYSTKPWEQDQRNREDRRIELSAPKFSSSSAGLGTAHAMAEATLAAGAPGALPVFHAEIVAGAQGEEGGGFDNGDRNQSHSGAEADVEIDDEIAFKKIEESGPNAEFLSLSMKIEGVIGATVKKVALPDRPRRAKGHAGVAYQLIVAADGAVAKMTEVKFARSVAGEAEEAFDDLDRIDTNFFIDDLRFDPTRVLKLTLRLHIGGEAISDSPAQPSNLSGNLSNSVYFTGLQFYDGDHNPLPPGAYSAIGAAGIDWTLSNVADPEAVLTILETTRAQGRLTLVFTGPPDVVDWSIKASTDLTAFTTDLTSSSTITETAPGTYQAVIDTSGQGENLFLRVEL